MRPSTSSIHRGNNWQHGMDNAPLMLSFFSSHSATDAASVHSISLVMTPTLENI
jgi:hypothetical protein